MHNITFFYVLTCLPTYLPTHIHTYIHAHIHLQSLWDSAVRIVIAGMILLFMVAHPHVHFSQRATTCYCCYYYYYT